MIIDRKNKILLIIILLILLWQSKLDFFQFEKVKAADPTTEPLLQLSDLQYLGAFRVPQGKYGILSNDSASTFSYGGSALSYDNLKNGLILTTASTSSAGKMIAEISIPQPVNSTNISDLNTASMVQNPVDIVNGQLANLGKDLNYSSSTSMSIATGTQNFTLSSVPKGVASGGGSGIVVGLPINITSSTDPTNVMSGSVSSISWINTQGLTSPSDSSIGDASVSVNITSASGTGTFNSWTVQTKGSGIANGGQFGNFLIWNNKLIGNAWSYYDAASQAFNSHYIASADWTNGSGFQGFYAVGTSPNGTNSPNGGFVGGYMASVPNEWQSLFGGTALTGLGGIPIITRSSFGPTAWVFNPSDLNASAPAPANMLVGYPGAHATLGVYADAPNLYFNRVTQVRGLVFPSGTRSVLFFGRHGLGSSGQGDSCYGSNISDPSLDRTFPNGIVDSSSTSLNIAKGAQTAQISSGLAILPGVGVILKSASNPTLEFMSGTVTSYSVNTLTVNINSAVGSGTYSDWVLNIATATGDASVFECYDPAEGGKGTHAYPYVYYVWAYDANDLLHVKNGDIISSTNRSANVDSSCVNGTTFQPWCVRPYAIWKLNLPFSVDSAQILGASYDPVTQRLFISEYAGNRVGYSVFPLIHVYQINTLPKKYGFSDFVNLISNWFHQGSGNVSDFNLDSITNSKDLGIMMSKWN